MLSSILSLILYIGTFLWGLYLEKHPNKLYTKLYLIWIYVFFCFGYMTGSDWRAYEVRYNSIQSYNPYTDILFYYYQLFASYLIKDFWLFCGLTKCIYLFSLISLVKCVTPYWKSTIAFLIPGTIVFMLIQNPLRFMVACVFINYSILYWLKGKYLPAVLVFIPSLLIHATSIAYVLLIPVLLFAKQISKINDIILLGSYILVLYVTSNQAIIQSIFESVVGQAMVLSEGLDKYTDYYSVEDVNTFFTIGSLMQVVFFVIILRNKRFFINSISNGELVYAGTIYYMFLAKFLLVIPTGFRLAIPFAFFFASCLSLFLMNNSKKLIISFFIIYNVLSFSSNLWTNYDLIPYSNSISYIVLGHKPYNERYNYNQKCYKERTGKTTDDWQDYNGY